MELVKELIKEQSIFFIIEIIIIIAVIIFQLSQTFSLNKRIIEFRNIFQPKLDIRIGLIDPEDNSVIYAEDLDEGDDISEFIASGYQKSIQIFSEKPNSTLHRIIDAINSYLVSNQGAVVNYSLIKDIVDREVDSKEEEINQAIPVPLYFGLAATMVGIIFGLFSMPQLSGTGFEKGIESLIDGVKIAMLASLFGLLCTTLLSAFIFKKARRELMNDKNFVLSFLQSKLLPELNDVDPSVSELKYAIDKFSRDVTTISTNLNEIVTKTSSSIEMQQDTINKVEKIKVNRLTKTNLELFDKLERNLSALSEFSEYIFEMREISQNLRDFSIRSQNIEDIANSINDNLIKAQDLYEFLSRHTKNLEGINFTVDIVEQHLNDALDKIKEQVVSATGEMQTHAANSQDKLKNELEVINNSINSMINEHLKILREKYTDSMPEFSHLERLDELPILVEKLDKNNQITENKTNEISDSTKALLNNLEKNNNRNELIKISGLINDLIKHSKSGSRSNNNNRPKSLGSKNISADHKNGDDVVEISKVIKKLF